MNGKPTMRTSIKNNSQEHQLLAARPLPAWPEANLWDITGQQ